MERAANSFRKPHPRHAFIPAQFNRVWIIGDAAGYFLKQIEPSGNVPGVVKFSRKAQPHMIFMSMVSHDLKGIA
jgi:hypothetical protein